MRITFILLCLLISLRSGLCIAQEDSVKTKLSLHSGIQLGSAKWSVPLIAEIVCGNNLCYLGLKIPVSINNLYGYFPIGAVGGYGCRLIQNEKWKADALLDVQWLGSKTQNQIKPTHYFDFTLNYQLTYAKWKRIHLSSSFGYGAFVKYFYRGDKNEWENNVGVSGLIRFGATYNL